MLPKRKHFLTEKVLPRERKSKHESDDPGRDIPNRDIVDPMRRYDRMDTELPSCTTSSALIVLPNLAKPNTDIVLPILQKLRKLMELPMWMKSITESELPRRATPKALMVLPKR